MSKNETILCQPINPIMAVFGLNRRGFISIDDVDDETFLNSNKMWWIPRVFAENTMDYRQLIPFIVLKYGNLIGIYERTSLSGESRLHHQISVGFGGHISTLDLEHDDGMVTLNSKETINNCITRELAEELPELSDDYILNMSKIGYLFYPNDAEFIPKVSRMHIGIVILCQLAKMPVGETEDSIGNFKFVSLSDIKKYFPAMETWSKDVCNSFMVK